MAAGRRFGKYLLHDRIAVGGMGELYLATEVGAARGTPPYVLKILLPEYSGDAEYVSMFHDEARIGMQLAHPNVVAVTDLGRVGDSNYLVLEYVHGENLRTLQNRIEDVGEKFPVETAIRIGIEVLQGLEHAHKAKDGRGKPLNLVHRDLSPDNVMLSFDGDVKVLDFGIAKSEGRATQTQFGILKGKVQYMSPEQALGQEVDARADLYALGLVLLEIITGERRFASQSDPVQMIRDARVWTAKGPSERDPSLPIELDAILLKSLQHEPARRWQSAKEFAAALARLLRGGGLPPAPEQIPALLRRLFPDRAEPFLQLEPTAGASAEAAREAALRVAPTNPGMEPRFGGAMPDEDAMLGAFLSPRERTIGRGGTASRGASPAGPASEDATSPGVRREELEDASERTVVGASPRSPPLPPEPRRSARAPAPTRLGEPTNTGPGPEERTDAGLSSPSADPRGRTRIARRDGRAKGRLGTVVLAGATLAVLLAAGGVLFRERLPPGVRLPLERFAARAGVALPAAPPATPPPAIVRTTPQTSPQATRAMPPPTPETAATPGKVEPKATPPPGADAKRAVGGGMFPGETTEEVETTQVKIDGEAPSPQTSPRSSTR